MAEKICPLSMFVTQKGEQINLTIYDPSNISRRHAWRWSSFSHHQHPPSILNPEVHSKDVGCKSLFIYGFSTFLNSIPNKSREETRHRRSHLPSRHFHVFLWPNITSSKGELLSCTFREYLCKMGEAFYFSIPRTTWCYGSMHSSWRAAATTMDGEPIIFCKYNLGFSGKATENVVLFYCLRRGMERVSSLQSK